MLHHGANRDHQCFFLFQCPKHGGNPGSIFEVARVAVDLAELPGAAVYFQIHKSAEVVSDKNEPILPGFASDFQNQICFPHPKENSSQSHDRTHQNRTRALNPEGNDQVLLPDSPHPIRSL